MQLSRTFTQFEFILKKLLSGYPKHVAKNAVDFITNNVTFLLLFHVFACAYIFVGNLFIEDDDSWVNARMKTNLEEGLPT